MDVSTIAAVTVAATGVVTFGGIVGGVILRDTFKTKKSCSVDKDACQTRVCKKIEEIKTDIQKQISIIDQKRESARKDNSEFQRAVYTHMGRIEQYIKDQLK